MNLILLENIIMDHSRNIKLFDFTQLENMIIRLAFFKKTFEIILHIKLININMEHSRNITLSDVTQLEDL